MWRKARNINVLFNYETEHKLGDLYASKTGVARYKRDKYGLRDDCAGPESIDILTIGGSTTDQRLLDLRDTFQAQMQKEILRRTGESICVSNAGIDGHSTFGHLYSFDKWFPLIPNLKPSFIILYIE